MLNPKLLQIYDVLAIEGQSLEPCAQKAGCQRFTHNPKSHNERPRISIAGVQPLRIKQGSAALPRRVKLFSSPKEAEEYIYIYIYIHMKCKCWYSCLHMRVHTFIHQCQYRYTNTEGCDDASIMCGDFYILATSKLSTWAVPATRPMETSF